MDARQAFEEVYAAHEPTVHAFALRRLGATGADDVVSEVFLAAWRRADELPADALPWLLNIARGVMSNRRRADVRWQALVARMSHERRQAGFCQAHDLDLGVFEALATLSETDRRSLSPSAASLRARVGKRGPEPGPSGRTATRSGGLVR